MTPPDPTLHISQELVAIQNFIAAAEDILRTGFMPSLSGLEERVSAVCQTIQTLPNDIQRQFLVTLNDVMQKLNACENNMRIFNETLLKSHGKS